MTSGRNQVGENWPEDWSLAKDRSYGLTFRIGGRVPILNTSAYVLAGVRRIQADFSRSYDLTTLCQPHELETGVEFFDEVGGGLQGIPRGPGGQLLQQASYGAPGEVDRFVRWPVGLSSRLITWIA